jgi:hypothetical protein
LLADPLPEIYLDLVRDELQAITAPGRVNRTAGVAAMQGQASVSCFGGEV